MNRTICERIKTLETESIHFISMNKKNLFHRYIYIYIVFLHNKRFCLLLNVVYHQNLFDSSEDFYLS